MIFIFYDSLESSIRMFRYLISICQVNLVFSSFLGSQYIFYDLCWWVSFQWVLIDIIASLHLWVDHTSLSRVSICYLVAARTTCLLSFCDYRILQSAYFHLETRSFLILKIMLLSFVLRSITTHLRHSLSLMSRDNFFTHQCGIKCDSDCQLVYHLSYGNKRIYFRHLRCKWRVPYVAIPDRRHPHLRTTNVYWYCQCIEYVQAHRVTLCIECTF